MKLASGFKGPEAVLLVTATESQPRTPQNIEYYIAYCLPFSIDVARQNILWAYKNFYTKVLYASSRHFPFHSSLGTFA
jgi:hypothetical protein